MRERIIVYVDDEPVELYRGMEVRHALISRGETMYHEAKAGRLVIVDDNGFALGLEGALADGAKIYSKPRPPETD